MPRWPDNNYRDKIIELRTVDPGINGTEIAKSLGISKQRASQLLMALGLPRGRQSDRKHFHTVSIDARTNHRASSIASGACGELEVCVDLLRRGFDVFRSVSASSRCDIVATTRSPPSRVIRIEVKVGKRGSKNTLHYAKPTADHFYDLLAVATDTEIVYLPDTSLLDGL